MGITLSRARGTWEPCREASRTICQDPTQVLTSREPARWYFFAAHGAQLER